MSDSLLTERTIKGLHAFLIKKLQELPDLTIGSSVLDIGCGTGAWLSRLASAGFTDLHGIDKDITQFGSTSASSSQANLDFDELGLQDRKYRLITAIELIEHLENVGKLFFHISKHLANDGYCIITTPNIHSLNARLRFMLTDRMPAFDEKSDSTHISPVLQNSIRRILPRYGLNIVALWPYPARGTLIFSYPVRVLSAILSKMVPNDLPGDISCMLVRKSGGIVKS